MNTNTAEETGFLQPITDLAPVFVVGFPRSGTTLVQQNAHGELWTALETHFFDKIIQRLKDWETRSLLVEELPGIAKGKQTRHH